MASLPRNCERCEQDPKGLCFKHKLRSIQFSAGAKTNPRNYYDTQGVEQIFGGKEDQEYYLDIVEGVPLRWRQEQGHRVPFRKDKVGDWVRADERDLDRVMYGSRRKKNLRD